MSGESLLIPEIPSVERGRSGTVSAQTSDTAQAVSADKAASKVKDKSPQIVKFGHTYMYVKNGVLIMSEVSPIKPDPVLTHEKKMEQMPLADR